MIPLSRPPFAWLLLIVAVGMMCPPLASIAQEATETAQAKPDKQDAGAEAAVEEKEQRFVVVLTIGEAEARALRRDGNLRATLPEHFHNRVDSVLLRHPTTFLRKKLVIEDDVDKVGRTLLVNVDESIVDRLEYQPVMIKVYQSGYNTIQLRYLRSNRRALLASIGRNSRPRPDDSPQMFVRLSPDNGTTGWVRGMKSLRLETEFGEFNMPLERVRGVRFNSDGPQDVTIVTNTGDYLSGKISLNEIVLATRWGDERIPIEKLESLTYGRDIRFLEGDPNVGQRWVLPSPQPTRAPVSAERFPRGSARPSAQPAQSFTTPPFGQPFRGNPAFRGLPSPRF